MLVTTVFATIMIAYNPHRHRHRRRALFRGLTGNAPHWTNQAEE